MAAVWGRSLLRSVANQTHLRTQVLSISSESSNALVKRKEAVPQNERKSEEIVSSLILTYMHNVYYIYTFLRNH